MGVSPGDAFLGDVGQLQVVGDHLWIVVHVHTPELDTTVHAIVVNATSSAFDKACILEVGDHPFITHRSYMYYQKTSEVPVADLQQFKPQPRASASLLTRIRKGLQASQHARKKYKDLVPKT